jgi:tRNA(Ile)-lysidine synthase
MESGSAVERAVDALPSGRWLLAVSGGRDSMVLLDAMARRRRDQIAGVATFDHGTGAQATAACDLVAQEASARGLTLVRGRAPRVLARTEAAWRGARWSFLSEAAASLGAQVVTAHTRDDQIETVVLRLLRGSGPRGLAGMLAGGPLRPLLTVPRTAVAAYAASHRVPYLDDPSNATPDFQRNRVRHEILPALERVDPGFGEWCWTLGLRAARWRAEVEALVDALGVRLIAPTTVTVPVETVAALDAAAWEVCWPAIAARAGVVMDRRGVDRAARWAPTAQAGQTIPLSGGARLSRTRTTYVVEGTVRGAGDYIP